MSSVRLSSSGISSQGLGTPLRKSVSGRLVFRRDPERAASQQTMRTGEIINECADRLKPTLNGLTEKHRAERHAGLGWLEGIPHGGGSERDGLLLDGTNVNHELVQDYWCWWHRKYATGGTVLGGLEKEAREKKRVVGRDAASAAVGIAEGTNPHPLGRYVDFL